MTRISVVLPFRNAAAWLPACLSSLTHQGERNWELLAVDDGSRDASLALVQAWAASQVQSVRLIRLPGLGVAAARNRGWVAARAPLVAFLDADDIAFPGRLQAQAARFDADPGLQHLLCGWRRLDADGAPLHDVRPWLEGAGFDLEAAFEHKAVLPSAWMLRRTTLERHGGFDPSLRHAEDVDLLLRLAAAGERGAWLKQVLCGYRVHGLNASRHVADQVQGLLWVVNQRLAALPVGHPLLARKRTLLFGTRAWAGWLAWSAQQPELALELWRTAWGSRSSGDAHTWLHLAENVNHSCRRIGWDLSLDQLLSDPTWQALESQVVIDLSRSPLRSGARLQTLATRLIGQLTAADPLWQPEALARWWPADGDRLAALRLRVLAWCEALQRQRQHQSHPGQLAAELAELLRQWARISWPEHADAARQRLEEAFDLEPSAPLARAIARLAADRYPWGARALEQLADRLPPRAGDALDVARFGDLPLPAPTAACRGPDCNPCAQAHLEALGWRRQPLASSDGGAAMAWLEQWWPPQTQRAGGHGQAPPFALHPLPHGRIWLRPPQANPWGTTHAVAVADGEGCRLPQLGRSYPHPWPGCPTPPSLCEPAPAGPPLAVAGTVLALADLSAEIHYHWLLDSLPRLGLSLALARGGAELAWPADWHLWHNGGNSERVRRSLVDDLGIPPERLIDARRHPDLTAERLLVPGPLHHFGWPSRRARAWLRRRYLKPDQRGPRRQGRGRRLWLVRGASARRPVFGEAALLAQLEQQGLALEPIVLEGLSLREQAACIAGAELLVLAHGGALAGLAFARPGTQVLELHQPRYGPPYGHALVAAGALQLVRCVQPATPPHLYSQLLFEAPICEPIVLDPERVATALRAMGF